MNSINDESSGRKAPNVRFLFSHPFHFISLGFGSGLSPFMPGTTGTLLGWLIFHVLVYLWPTYFNQFTWGIIVAAGFMLGIWTCSKTGIALNSPDDGSMVWDEIIGIWLVLLVMMPTTLIMECWAFLLFRFFDMLKPPPIRQLDAGLKGGLGVMLDDILAAIYTIIVLMAGYYLVSLIPQT